MAIQAGPKDSLAEQVLRRPLRTAIYAVFSSGMTGCALVGGTALAGYYAGHRKSDDLDLFTADPVAQQMAIAAVMNLSRTGVTFQDTKHSPTYFHTLLTLDGHSFTADVVLDSNLHRIGGFVTTENKVVVADLPTLHKMKVAALVSRCSEKDLFDLCWLHKNFNSPSMKEFIELGKQVDPGVSGETLLISLCGSTPRASACTFAETHGSTAQCVFEQISDFKIYLQKQLVMYLEESTVDIAIAPLIRKLRRLR